MCPVGHEVLVPRDIGHTTDESTSADDDEPLLPAEAAAMPHRDRELTICVGLNSWKPGVRERSGNSGSRIGRSGGDARTFAYASAAQKLLLLPCGAQGCSALVRVHAATRAAKRAGRSNHLPADGCPTCGNPNSRARVARDQAGRARDLQSGESILCHRPSHVGQATLVVYTSADTASAAAATTAAYETAAPPSLPPNSPPPSSPPPSLPPSPPPSPPPPPPPFGRQPPRTSPKA